MQNTLEKNVVVLTGAAGFLGEFFARQLYARGASLALIDLKQPAYLDEMIPKRVEFFRVDITSEEEWEYAVGNILEKFGIIDSLINNAANNPQVAGAQGRAISSRLGDWKSDIEVGLTGTFLATMFCGELMVKQKSGSIVTILSDLAVIAPDQRIYSEAGVNGGTFVKPASYSAVKFGQLGLVRYFATLWGNTGVRVNAISPGGIFNGQSPEFVEAISRRVPMQRMANREDLIGPMCMLLSQDSAYMTGANVVIDGGRSIW